jgi:uncharacterized membrane protein YhaH (DUF805 family)
MHWMILPYRRYFDFGGRSRRSEYWWFMVFAVLVSAVLLLAMFGGAFDTLLRLGEGQTPSFDGVGPLFWVALVLLVIFGLATIIPSIAVQVRRLHDLNVSGWWYLGYIVGGAAIGEIPEVGDLLSSLFSLAWLVWMFFPGTRGANKYGDDPKDPMNVEAFA